MKLLMDKVINIERQIPMNSLRQTSNIPLTVSLPQTTGAGGSGHREPIYQHSLPPTPQPIYTTYCEQQSYSISPEVQPVQSFRNQNQSVSSGNLHYQPKSRGLLSDFFRASKPSIPTYLTYLYI